MPVLRALIAVAAIAGIGGSVPLSAQTVFESTAPVVSRSRIDDLVLANLKRAGIRPARLSSDAVFLRRVYLDTIGTLPTADETRTFLADRRSDKRARLIDRLLARDEFADYWAMKWSDLLRVKSEFPINLWPNAVQAYHHWIRDSIRTGMPYDRFVRELLTESGSNFRVPPVNFYRAVQSRDPESIAQAVALTFMGVRADRWPKQRLSGMAAFFSRIGYKSTDEWKEEIVFFDPLRTTGDAAGTGPPEAVFPDGTVARISPDQDPREAFANWLIAPRNPWFARNVVNRIWAWLLGRGIVHEPDDIRPDNPPSNPELLAYLERELAAGRYDLKHVYRLILNSTTYQLSSIGTDGPEAAAHFSHYALRPLDAEVLIDALCQITGTTEEYSSPIPEPYTFIPGNQRAIALADGSISSAFLETFGRPSRDSGLESERASRPTAAGRLHLLNSSHIQRKLEESDTLRQVIQAKGDMRQVIENLYLAILSRFPTSEETETALAYARSAANRRAAGLDIAWALVNGTEFLYRH